MGRTRTRRTWATVGVAAVLFATAAPGAAGAGLPAQDPPTPGSPNPGTSDSVPGVVGPPPIGETPVPPGEAPKPADKTVRKGGCVTGSSEANSADGANSTLPVSWAQEQLGYQKAWPFSRGAGQRVAVIDTGVNENPRLRVVPGGDYVNGPERGLVDCDAHGSVVASIIGAAPAGGDDYAGVAPEAEIFAVRQYSAQYTYADPKRAEETGGGYGDVASLARAVVWAADQDSTVINISEAACGLAGEGLARDNELGAALRYAAVDQDVVVVVAAGNASREGGECSPGNDPTGVAPPAVVASPAWWDDYVLTVGSTNIDGTPSEFTLAGPWVDVAAPGTEIVSVNPVGGPPLINQLSAAGGEPELIQGTSFAAPYVSGTAALVRQRFPELTAEQVMNRIKATAQAPGGGRNWQVGHGTVDPLAAVTDILPADVKASRADGASAPVAGVMPVAALDTTPRVVALAGSAGALGALALTFVVIDVLRRARSRSLPR